MSININRDGIKVAYTPKQESEGVKTRAKITITGAETTITGPKGGSTAIGGGSIGFGGGTTTKGEDGVVTVQTGGIDLTSPSIIKD